MTQETIWKRLLLLSRRIAKGAIVYYYIRTYICEVSILEGPSMEPTLSDGSVVLVDKFSWLFKGIRRRDVVSFRSPIDDDVILCKRVTGIGGDFVTLNNNKKALISNGFLWLEGDNKPNSIDSRVFGPIKRERVIGSVILQLYPRRTWINELILNDAKKNYCKV